MEIAKEQAISDPAFSITVPVRDRWGSRLRNCVRSLEMQTLRPIEIIVADYGSTEQGHEAIMEALEGFDCTVYYYPTDEIWNLSRARNMGIRRSNPRCENVAVVDADLILEPRVFEVLSQAHASRPRSYISSFIWMLRSKIWPHYKEFMGNCATSGQSLVDCNEEYRKLYPGKLDEEPDDFGSTRDFAKLKNLAYGESAGRGGLVSAPRDWLFKVRGFDERMKFWGAEDGDLWKRAGLDGMDCYRINDLEETDTEIYHQTHKDCISGIWVNGPYEVLDLTAEENRQIEWNKMIATRDNTLMRNNDNWGLWRPP
jgi:glycosyltransferase involved in cell wall biosynthesis